MYFGIFIYELQTRQTCRQTEFAIFWYIRWFEFWRIVNSVFKVIWRIMNSVYKVIWRIMNSVKTEIWQIFIAPMILFHYWLHNTFYVYY